MTELSFSFDELSDLLDWASDSVMLNRDQINSTIDEMLYPGQQQQQQRQQDQHQNQQQQQQQHGGEREIWERIERQKARSTVSRAALVFTQQFFAQIHDTLCVRNKLNEAVSIGGADARTITTAIAAGLAASIGLSGPISISVATFVLLVISRAGLNAFCVATKSEMLEEMSKADKALSRSRKRR